MRFKEFQQVALAKDIPERPWGNDSGNYIAGVGP